MNDNFYRKVYQQVFPLGLLGNLTEDDFIKKVHEEIESYEPGEAKEKLLHADPQETWEIIKYISGDLLQSLHKDYKWSTDEILWSINKSLGGDHTYTVIEEANEDGYEGDMEFEWDKERISLSNVSLIDFIEKMNDVLEKQGNPYIFVNFDTEGDDYFLLKVKRDQKDKLRYFPEYLGKELPEAA